MRDSIPPYISVSDSQEISFWCRYFNCTERELLDAVDKMGNCTEEVLIYIGRKSTKKGFKFWAILME